jgi:hypothetical protein
VTVSRNALREFFINFSCDGVWPCDPLPKTGQTAGIDRGLKDFGTLQSGERIRAPQPLKQALKRDQKSLSRAEPKSQRLGRQKESAIGVGQGARARSRGAGRVASQDGAGSGLSLRSDHDRGPLTQGDVQTMGSQGSRFRFGKFRDHVGASCEQGWKDRG